MSLSVANLRLANLQGADLREANLREAYLQEAYLQGADLRRADLREANLSGVRGLLDPIDWLKTLECNNEGIICYKRIGSTAFSPPVTWSVKAGAILTEVVNFDRTLDCACGVNVSTIEWCYKNYTNSSLWKCLILWADLAGVCVPYNTDGKFRASRVTLLECIT